MSETEFNAVFTHKEYLALQQIVKAMLLKGEMDQPGYFEEIKGIANMARISSVDVDMATLELLDQFKADLAKVDK
jgi:hypothetical protein